MLTLEKENRTVDDFSSSANGKEDETEQDYTKRKYNPEDFSQAAINDGQRMINYQLTEAAKRLSQVLALLTEALAKTSCVGEDDLVKINKVIAEASAISNTVADIVPPGCKPPPPPPPPPPAIAPKLD